MKNRLINTPVSILSKDARLSAYGILKESDLDDDFVLLVPFEAGSPESKVWPSVVNPFHIKRSEIIGIFELINTHELNNRDAGTR